jgi:hypothetical protein
MPWPAEARRQGPGGVAALFLGGTTLPHSPRAQVSAEEDRRSGRRGVVADTFFRRNHFSSFLRTQISGSLKPRDRASQRASLRFFVRGALSFSSIHRRPLAAPALSPAARSLAPRCMEIVEFWQYGKRTRRCSDCFRQHPDAILANVAKEMAPLGEMPNL